MTQIISPSLSEPINWFYYTLLAILVGLCQAGGIGGGPVISPVMMFLFQMPPINAIWNTFIMIFGGSTGNFIRLGRERTSNKALPLINYTLVMISLPLLLSGAIFGVSTGRWLPILFDECILFLILITVLMKVIQLYKKSRAKEKSEQTISLINHQSQTNYDNNLNIQQSATLNDIYKKEKALFPPRQLLEITFQVSVVVFLTILKGAETTDSFVNIEYCSLGYHGINLAILLFGITNLIRYRYMIIRDESRKKHHGFQFEDGQLSIVFNKTVLFSFIAGFLGGLAGLGGGVILTPLWMDMGIPQRRAAASASFSVIFTSLISMTIIALSGGYTISLFFTLFIFASIGSYLIAGFLKNLAIKLNRESVILIVLMGVVSFGLIILPIQNIKNLLQNYDTALNFGRFC